MQVGDQVRYVGDGGVVHAGRPCVVLAIDPECPDARGAAWIRQWVGDYPLYRSVDLCDLEAWSAPVNET